MRQFLVGCVVAVCAVMSGVSGARAQALAVFEAAAFDAAERRLLQTALAASGDYRGGLHGTWDPASQAAAQAYAAREFSDIPREIHAAALLQALAETIEQGGWSLGFDADLGLSYALPHAALGLPEIADGATRWTTAVGDLAVMAFDAGFADAADWHDAAARADAFGEAARRVRTHDRMITEGTLADGWTYSVRSVRVAGRWATLHLEAAPGSADAQAMLNLIAASIEPGAPLAWEPPADGRLAELLDASFALAQAQVADVDASAVEVLRPADLPAPQQVRRPPAGPGLLAAGTGFYLGDRLIVTAEHVVAGCRSVTLGDGTELALLASDPDLDVAALRAPGPAATWLNLAPARDIRLGQPVHALGFPYYALAGTSLNLTSGNVSALAGIDDDGRFFSFTAPVQPGNSGGPLIDRTGAVTGVVVARLSEDFIVDATGTVPQNVNYALGTAELIAFLDRAGAQTARGGLDAFDMGDGAPSEITQAIVPILCH